MSLKHLFLAGFLTAGLVGCSSTPTSDEGSASNEKNATAVTTGTAGTGTGAAGENLSAEEQAQVAVQEKQDQLQKLKAAALGKMVHFDFDKSEIKPEYFPVIQAEADYLAADPQLNVTVEGHCDERGTREYNLALGERRANAVKNALVAQGISPSRITTISYGEERPLDPRHNEEAWAKNRRAEFKFQ